MELIGSNTTNMPYIGRIHNSIIIYYITMNLNQYTMNDHWYSPIVIAQIAMPMHL
jgi:hypothetical protein